MRIPLLIRFPLIYISVIPFEVAAADITYIDKRVRSESQEYGVVFSAYGGEFGHSFVTTVWGDDVQRATLQRGVGFYPGDSDKDLKVAFGGEGVLVDDTWKRGEVVLSVLVNKEAFDRATAVIAEWERPRPYFLVISDCTTLVAQVAEAVGLTMPSRLFAPYPIDFLRELVHRNQ